MRTVSRGPDGFGSQMLTLFLGYLNALRDEEGFCYTQIGSIQLAVVGTSNQELIEMQSVVDTTMENLGVPVCSGEIHPITHISFQDNYSSVSSDTFNRGYLDALSNAWPLESPYDGDKFNITIHLRRGGDISGATANRWTPSEYYNELIPKLLNAYPKALIHVVSWGDPQLDLLTPDTSRVKYYSDNTILTHYNMLVHADMCFIASSTFSASAALFNKNKVLLDPALMKLETCPTSQLWITNFDREKNLW